MSDRPAGPTHPDPIGAEEVRNFLWQLVDDSELSLYRVTACADGTAALSLVIRRYWQAEAEARSFRVTVEAMAPDGAHAATDAPVP